MGALDRLIINAFPQLVERGLLGPSASRAYDTLPRVRSRLKVGRRWWFNLRLLLVNGLQLVVAVWRRRTGACSMGARVRSGEWGGTERLCLFRVSSLRVARRALALCPEAAARGPQ